MAPLKALALKKSQAKAELKTFKALLDGPGKGDLGEAKDLLPSFDAHEHLCALMGTYNPNIIDYKNIHIAREFSIFGDHKADLAIGDTRNSQFCFIEFEDAKGTSIFNTKAAKSTPDWSTRYEHGFSQLIDWILWIENNNREDRLHRPVPITVHPVQHATGHRPRPGSLDPSTSRKV